MRRDQIVTGAGFVSIDSSDNQINVGVVLTCQVKDT
jgi:hypothetical protein